MYWLAVALGLAIAATLLTGGNPTRVLRLPIHSLWLLILGLGIQVGLWVGDLPADRFDDVGFALLMLSYALVLAFCFANLRVWGMVIVTIGVLMNAVVIGLNEGMPTRDREVETASGREVERPIERTAVERPESDDDLLGFLGQIILLPDNPVDEDLAPGDIVIAAGMILVFVAGGRRRRPEQEAEQEEGGGAADVEEAIPTEVAPAPRRAAPPAEPPPSRPPPAPSPPPQAPPPPERPRQPPPRRAEPEPARARTAAEEWEAWKAELAEMAGGVDEWSDDDEGHGSGRSGGGAAPR